MSDDPNPYRRGWRVARSLAHSDRKDLAAYLENELRLGGRICLETGAVNIDDVKRALTEARP